MNEIIKLHPLKSASLDYIYHYYFYLHGTLKMSFCFECFFVHRLALGKCAFCFPVRLIEKILLLKMVHAFAVRTKVLISIFYNFYYTHEPFQFFPGI